MLKSIRGSDFLQKFNDYFTTVLFDCDGRYSFCRYRFSCLLNKTKISAVTYLG